MSLMLNTPFHPYYIFCNVKTNFNTDNSFCNHFGGFINNQCNDYFNRIKDDKCESYINQGNDIEKLNLKWFPFLSFILNHNKFYNSFSDVLNRVEVFESNNQYAALHNKYSNSSYTLGITPFSDMTNDEFRKYISLSEVDLASDMCKSQIKPSTTYPTSIDWRQKNAVTPGKD